jgi:hypothetical protein
MAEWKIEGLWDEEDLRELSLVWHHLEPWSDSAMGVELLNKSAGTSGSFSVCLDWLANAFSYLYTFERQSQAGPTY